MHAATHGDRLNTLDLADDFEVQKSIPLASYRRTSISVCQPNGMRLSGRVFQRAAPAACYPAPVAEDQFQSEPPKAPRSMHERQNEYLFLGYLVDKTIGPYQQFPDRFVAELWNNLASLGKVGKRSRSFLDLLDKRCRVESGILCDVICGILHVLPGGISPGYFSIHRAIRRSASSWEITCPRSAASSPFWIF